MKNTWKRKNRMQKVAGPGRDNLSRCEDELVAMSVTCVYVSIISHSISLGDTPSVTFIATKSQASSCR